MFSREIVMYETSKRYFRATFVDAASTDMQITIEFEAPFPITEEIDYSQIAIDSFTALIKEGHIKIRDIEPIEV